MAIQQDSPPFHACSTLSHWSFNRNLFLLAVMDQYQNFMVNKNIKAAPVRSFHKYLKIIIINIKKLNEVRKSKKRFLIEVFKNR